jgi:hypothetical protein
VKKRKINNQVENEYMAFAGDENMDGIGNFLETWN